MPRSREHNRIPLFGLGHSTLAFLRALLSFAPEHLDEVQVSARGVAVSARAP